MEPFAGCNTRWETIGTLFIAFTYALLSFPEAEILACFGRKENERQALIAEMKGCVEACIELCRSSLNTLVCHVLYKNMLLETIIRGDASRFIKPCPGQEQLLIILQASQNGGFTTTLLELLLQMVSTAIKAPPKSQFSPK
jgi:hypothetical protein